MISKLSLRHRDYDSLSLPYSLQIKIFTYKHKDFVMNEHVSQILFLCLVNYRPCHVGKWSSPVAKLLYRSMVSIAYSK